MKRIKELNRINQLLNEFNSSFFSTMEAMNIDPNVWAKKITKHGILYVKEVNQISIGLLIFYANDEQINTSFLSYIVVKEKYRGCHIGDEMIKFWMDYVSGIGYKFCRLEVDVRNERAFQFYKKHGFEIEKTNSNISVFMQKQLQ